jgi:hypothetical protein
MTLDASQVRIAITGELSVAPLLTAAPTSSTSSLDAAFVGLGYVGEDGVTKTPNDVTEAIRAWQNAARVRTVFTEKDWAISLLLIESKGSVAELYYKGDITVVSAGVWSIVPDTVADARQSFVLDVIDGSIHERIYIPTGEVTERAEVVYANGQPIGRGVTLTCYYDDTISGPFKVFTDDAAWGYS